MKDVATKSATGEALPLQGVSMVTYDEEEPLEAHAIPMQEAQAVIHQDGPHTTNPGASSNGATPTPPLASGHGCDIYLCGDTRLRQMTPGYHFSLNLCGNYYLDLLDSVFPPGTAITLISIRLCGSFNITVPAGTQVVVRRLQLCGSRDIMVDNNPEQEQPAPRLTLYILSLTGSIRVRSNRTAMHHQFHAGSVM
jgi:hypothetical protein